MEYWSGGVMIQSPTTPTLHYSICLRLAATLTGRFGAPSLRFAVRRRGSQVVRSGSAKPLFAGSIPAPALSSGAGCCRDGVLFLAPGFLCCPRSLSHTLRGFLYVARPPPAPFPPPPWVQGRFCGGRA